MGYDSPGISLFLMTLAILRPFCIISLCWDLSDVLFIVVSQDLCV